MKGKVYINSIASFLPGVPVPNEEMEDYLGLIGGKPSRVKPIVLRQNGIKTRYYNTQLHAAAFALPNYVEEMLEDVES